MKLSIYPNSQYYNDYLCHQVKEVTCAGKSVSYVVAVEDNFCIKYKENDKGAVYLEDGVLKTEALYGEVKIIFCENTSIQCLESFLERTGQPLDYCIYGGKTQ